MQIASNPVLWRSMPPAIFPPFLGLFALGLAWRRAVDVFFIPSAIGDLVLGATTMLYILAVAGYVAKLVCRPSALADDLRIMPGRAGMATATVAAMVLAASLVEFSASIATGIVILALALHGVVAVVVLSLLWHAPLEQRRITPVWHLTFVGFVVAPLSAVPLGLNLMSELILILTIPIACVIWVGHAVVTYRRGVPAPLRPVLMIHLAPICLFGIVSALLGYDMFAGAMGWLAVLVAAILVIRIRYLTAAGFSPFWGAFTFPMAAFVNLMLILAGSHQVFYVLGGLGLAVATMAIPAIAFRIAKLFVSGQLARKTNAAVA